jgi:hypothetical protein
MNDEKPKSLEERKVDALELIAEYLFDAKSELEEIRALLENVTYHPTTGTFEEGDRVIMVQDISR